MSYIKGWIFVLSLLVFAGCGEEKRTVAEEGSTEENNASIEVVFFEDLKITEVPGTWSLEEGSSFVKWGIDGGKAFSTSWLKSMEKACGGLCGSLISDGTETEGGVALNLDFTEVHHDGYVYADVSSWNRLCLLYSSSLDFNVELESVDSLGHVRENDRPRALYKKTPAGNAEVFCVDWINFKKGSRGISGVEAASRLKSLIFSFVGKSGSFNIKRIGSAVVDSLKMETDADTSKEDPVVVDSDSLNADTLDADEIVSEVDSSMADTSVTSVDTLTVDTSEVVSSTVDTSEADSSAADTLVADTSAVDTSGGGVVPEDSSGSVGKDPPDEPEVEPEELVVDADDLIKLWDGFGAYRVETGFAGKAGDGGVWYAFDDHDYEGTSKIVWPTTLGGSFSSKSLNDVMDECGGLCGTIYFDRPDNLQKPFVGVAFNVVGTENKTGAPLPADVTTKWKGLCFQYMSDMDGAVVLDPGNEVAEQLHFALPEASFEKSETLVRKCVGWNHFKTDETTNGTPYNEAERLVTIRFKFMGDPGTSGEFYIKRVEAVKADPVDVEE